MDSRVHGDSKVGRPPLKKTARTRQTFESGRYVVWRAFGWPPICLWDCETSLVGKHRKTANGSCIGLPWVRSRPLSQIRSAPDGTQAGMTQHTQQWPRQALRVCTQQPVMHGIADSPSSITLTPNTLAVRAEINPTHSCFQ